VELQGGEVVLTRTVKQAHRFDVVLREEKPDVLVVVSDPAVESGDQTNRSGDSSGEGGEFIFFRLANIKVLDAVERGLELLERFLALVK
jgi:hypothetical protein